MSRCVGLGTSMKSPGSVEPSMSNVTTSARVRPCANVFHRNQSYDGSIVFDDKRW